MPTVLTSKKSAFDAAMWRVLASFALERERPRGASALAHWRGDYVHATTPHLPSGQMCCVVREAWYQAGPGAGFTMTMLNMMACPRPR